MKRFILSTIAFLFLAFAASAEQTVTIVKTLNGEVVADAQNAIGTVTYSIDQENDNMCVITVVPTNAYYVGEGGVSAVKLIDATQAQARLNAPAFSSPIEVMEGDVENTWIFQMPSEKYNVEVSVAFTGKTSIADAIVNLSETAYNYDGDPKTPEVTSVMLGDDLIVPDYYDVVYGDNSHNNSDAGTVTVYVTGKDTYMGTATATFAINKAALSELSVEIDGWTYGQYDEEVNLPRISGNEGEGEESVYYKVKDAADNTYTETVPTNAGTYTVKVEVDSTYNYAAGSATADFTIAKANITPTVTLQGWTYGDAANTPSVTGNSGNGAVAYSYANKAAANMTYSSTVPTAAGSYSVKAVVAATDNYNSAETTTDFTIAQADFSQVVIADIADQTYNNGDEIKPEITVTFKGNDVDASEYNVSYASNTDAGTATVMLTTKNVNFKAGTTNPSKTFQIVTAQAVITLTAESQTVTFNGDEQTFTAYTVDHGSVNVSFFASEADRAAGKDELEAVVYAGTYYVQLTQGDGNYTSEPVNATLIIEPKTLADDMLWTEYEDDFYLVYDGQPKTLEQAMYGLSDSAIGLELEEDEDYTVSYANNTNVGTATMTFTGKGNYQGTVTITFGIARQLNIAFSGSNEWASYYATEDLSIPEGLEAYKVTEIGTTEVTTVGISYIPKNVAVLLKKNESANVQESYVAEAYTGQTTTFADNKLLGTAAATAVTSITGGSVYVLFNDMFVKSTSGTIPANRGYLLIPNSNAARTLGIDIDVDATGIGDAVRLNDNEQRNMNNGADAVYDLQGRRVNGQMMKSSNGQMKQGLYIMNGKKYIVK